MNVEDSIRRSNSWHWLVAVAALSAAGSVFMPTYGWRDAFAYQKTALEPRVKNAQSTLDALKGLDEAEALAADKKSADLKARTAKLRQDFATYGLDPIPEGDDAIFAAQSRISEALAKRRIRIVSNEASTAKTDGETVAAVSSKPPYQNASDGRAASTKPLPMSAAEYRKQVEAQAAKMNDKKVREMFLADARRQIARMEQAEKQGKTAGTGVSPSSATAVNAQKRIPPTTARGYTPPPPFRTSEIDYKTVGDFRDVFMFFVSETHRKSNYTFRDIAVRRGTDGMDVSFTLRVQYK